MSVVIFVMIYQCIRMIYRPSTYLTFRIGEMFVRISMDDANEQIEKQKEKTAKRDEKTG